VTGFDLLYLLDRLEDTTSPHGSASDLTSKRLEKLEGTIMTWVSVMHTELVHPVQLWIVRGSLVVRMTMEVPHTGQVPSISVILFLILLIRPLYRLPLP
jgi:hypothetical protein